MKVTAQKVIDLAKSQIGVKEQPADSNTLTFDAQETNMNVEVRVS